jgi:hypothetical protein
MGSNGLSGQTTLAISLLVLATSTLPAAACGWWCGSEASHAGRASRFYAYQAYLPKRPALRPLSRAQVLATPRVPGGPTTLDPPGLMTMQGILESPVPSTGPTLFGSGAPQYAYSGMASHSPRARRARR